MTRGDVTFPSMGSDVRILLEGRDADRMIARCHAFLEDFEARLSRFRPDSDLCLLNTDPRPVVPAGALLRDAVRAACRAAADTHGLVDPTLVDALEAVGYAHSRSGPELSLSEALRAAPPRAAARPSSASRWSAVDVDEIGECIRRPPGVRIDTGGTGKGLAADLLAVTLGRCPTWAVDCGGDLRAGGTQAARRPFGVEIAHPLSGASIATIPLRRGAIATSGLDVRLWRRDDGRPAHHLLDPSTGEPAWTGLVGATALAPTAVEAEVRAKAALLSGPEGARRWLARHGGLVVRDDGSVDRFGRLGAPAVSLAPVPA